MHEIYCMYLLLLNWQMHPKVVPGHVESPLMTAKTLRGPC
jgi:hypothetical protein